ncbi:MAG: ribosome maturation factor RimM [Bacillota bacterium]|nr:ribosome maturation factor RimM [Bacillota bacterium]
MKDMLRLGKVTGAAGLKGELRVYPYTDYKEKFQELSYVLMDDKPRRIEKVRYHKNLAILKLEGIEDRSGAEACREKELFIRRADAPPLPEDSYYVADLLGLTVQKEDGEVLGRLKDVILHSAQDLYEVERPGGKSFLLPAVDEFVKDVDLEKGVITVRLIEGLLNED